ncbi:MAG: tripartite tricarboxylate transporter substrate binding protein [Burkholderiales bacterium]
MRPPGLLTLLIVIAAGMAAPEHAYAFPERPVRVVVPFPPGGGADVTIRIMSDALRAQLGQPIVVENRAGASTIIGTDLVAKARPDGYTLLMVTSTFAINPSLHATLPYDPLKDLAPITLVALTPYIVVVHPSLPVRSIKDLIALAKSKPGELNYASVGNGSSTHLATEMFASRAGVKMVHVPYKGSAPAVTDLIGGHVTTYFGSMPGSLPQARAGKLRALAVTGPSRAPAAPEVPTVAESGLPGYEFTAWYGLFAPSGTPPGIIGQLHNAITKVLDRGDVRERFAAEGNQPSGETPQQFAATVKADIVKYARIVKDAQIKPD